MSRVFQAASVAAISLTAGAAVAMIAVPGRAQQAVSAVVSTPVEATGSATILNADVAPAATDAATAAPAVEILDEATPVQPARPEVVVPATATATRATSLAQLVRTMGAPVPLDSEAHCMAVSVYFESKGQTLDGQLAVAEVMQNRARSGRFPRSICGVLRQPSQFSFVRGGQWPRIDTSSHHWRQAVAITRIAREGLWRSPAPGALFFHATHVAPRWRLSRIARIDDHIFYR